MGRRFTVVAVGVSLLCLALGAASSSAGSSPPSTGPLAPFLACIKAHGAPTLGHHSGDKAKGDQGTGDQGKSGSATTGTQQGSGTHEHGKPHGWPGRLSDADRAALKKAFDACRDLLPKRTAGTQGDRTQGDHAGHKFTLPTVAQLQAFRSCMADKGFSWGKPGSGTRPDFRDPAVRSAFGNALKACAPLLKPASSG